jgi:hypothetical protein
VIDLHGPLAGVVGERVFFVSGLLDEAAAQDDALVVLPRVEQWLDGGGCFGAGASILRKRANGGGSQQAGDNDLLPRSFLVTGRYRNSDGGQLTNSNLQLTEDGRMRGGSRRNRRCRTANAA